MRIVIDMQGMQTGSRYRGIGRYTESLTKAILRNRQDHEIYLILNGLFGNTIEPILREFDGLLPRECIKIWNSCGPIAYIDPRNHWRRKVASFIYEDFIKNLSPDVVLLTSVFEGFGDDFVIGNPIKLQGIPIVSILYDLIPLMNPDEYLADRHVRAWYDEQLVLLKNSQMLLAISESSRVEGIEVLGFDPEHIINISSAVEEKFQPATLSLEEEHLIREKYDLPKDFLMYSGASDPRKNHLRLIQAYSNISECIRQDHQLVIVGGMPEEHKLGFKKEAARCGLTSFECRIVGRVDDDDLIKLYQLCKGYIFPSWHEGFGLPALEAMSCGRPVIASNTSSLPEVVGIPEALFNPFDIEDISLKIEKLLTDIEYRKVLTESQSVHAKSFSWDSTANKTFEALLKVVDLGKLYGDGANIIYERGKKSYAELGRILSEYTDVFDDADLCEIANVLASNETSLK